MKIHKYEKYVETVKLHNPEFKFIFWNTKRIKQLLTCVDPKYKKFFV